MTERYEFKFRIDAFTPQSLPMLRLAEYMAELARLLGDRERVHFVRLDPGSAVLVHETESEAYPKVRGRIAAVSRGEPPRDALEAYQKIDAMLA